MDAAMADPEKSKVVGVWLAQKYGVRNWAGMSRVAREAWSKPESTEGPRQSRPWDSNS